MNLENILIDSVAGFSYGFFCSYNLRPYTNTEVLDIISLIPENERIKMDSTIDNNSINRTKKKIAFWNGFIPLIGSAGLSGFFSSINHENLIENAFITVPSAYAGYIVGKFSNYMRFRERKKLFLEIKNNPKLAPELLLSSESLNKLNKIFYSLEEVISLGLDIKQILNKNVEEVQGIINKNMSPYTPLLTWLYLTKINETLEKGYLRREIEFFYSTSKSTSGNCCAKIVGTAKHNRMKLYVLEENEIYTETINLPTIRFVDIDENKGAESQSSKNFISVLPSVEEESCKREIWNEDFRGIAHKIYDSRENTASVLLRVQNEIGIQDIRNFAVQCYVLEVGKHLKKKFVSDYLQE